MGEDVNVRLLLQEGGEGRMKDVDKTINIVCSWIQGNVREDGTEIKNQDDVTEMIRALAELVSARGRKQSMIMSFQELREMGFPRKYLERAYHSKNNTFAFKEDPAKSRSTILFNVEGFEQWRQKEIKAQRAAR